MDSNERFTDLDGHLNDLNGRVTGLSENVSVLGERVGVLTERVSELAHNLIELTSRVTAVEQDLAVIKANYSTKADLLEVRNHIVIWVISAFFLTQLLPALLKKFGM